MKKIVSLIMTMCMILSVPFYVMADSSVDAYSAYSQQMTIDTKGMISTREVTKTCRFYKNINYEGRTVSIIVNCTLAGMYDVDTATGKIIKAGNSRLKDWSYTVNSPVEGDPWYVECINLKTFDGSISLDKSKATFSIQCSFTATVNPGGIDFETFDLFDVHESVVGYV